MDTILKWYRWWRYDFLLHTLLSCDGQDCRDRWTIQLVPSVHFGRRTHCCLFAHQPHSSEHDSTADESQGLDFERTRSWHFMLFPDAQAFIYKQLVRIEYHPGIMHLEFLENFGSTPILPSITHLISMLRPCFESVLGDKNNAYRYGQNPDSSA